MRLVVPLALAAMLAPFAVALPPGSSSCVEATTVDVESNGFVPGCIVIDSGDVVTWSNVGGRPHQLSSDELAPVTAVTGEPCVQSGVFDGGESVSLLFVRAGTAVTVDGRECTLLAYHLPSYVVGETRIPYHCTLHPSMAGEIVVRA